VRADRGLTRGSPKASFSCVAGRWWRCYGDAVIAIQKKIVVDEHGVPQEVIIPWAQFCELSEALGLDLDEEAMEDLRVARERLLKDGKAAFMPLSEL
jgi:hypothetical protein